MLRTTIKQAALVALALAASLTSDATAGAPPSARGLLTIQGRVLNDAGQPLADAWVYTKGSRRLSTYSQSDGHYTISVPGATLRELIRSPFKLEVHARRKSWNILHTHGPAALGLEMYVESDDAGGLVLNIRSNDPAVAVNIAKAAVLDANPRVVVDANFDGRPGVQIKPRHVVMQETQQVRLAGLTLEEVDPVTSRQLASARAASKRWSPVTGRAREAVVRTPAAAAVAAELRDLANEPSVLQVERTMEEVPVAARAAVAVPVRTDVAVHQSAPVTRFEAQPNRTTAQDQNAQAVVSAAPTTEARNTRSATPVSSLPSDIDGPARTSSEVIAAPAASQRSRWTPSRETLEDCDCTIRGTVETARPLSNGMMVTIAIDGLPEATSNVELFMGSPRGFRLGNVPCGSHQVSISTDAKRRYRLKAKSGQIDCKGGSAHHVRLVLIEDRSLR